MFDIIIWIVYGLFVGNVAKVLVPGDEKLGFLHTVALGVIGSYVGGGCLYLLGDYETIYPSGILMGIAGSVLALIVYNKLNVNS